METKKNPKANLEKSRGIFFQIGLVVALAMVLLAFKFATTTNNIAVIENEYADVFEPEEIINTIQEPKLKIIPPMPVIPDLLIINPDDEDTPDDIPIFTSETDGKEAIFIQTIKLQEEETYISDPIPFAEKMPEFPGGTIGLQKFIADHVKYPPLAIETGLEGKVYVRFCVTSSGMVERVSIARGVDELLDKEAMRVVKILPKWKPGENGGRFVSVWYTVPIVFKLK